MGQTDLKIGHFLGTSENAVRTQIVVALIAFVLLRLAHEANGGVESPLAFARLIRANLMERRPIGELLRRPSPGFEPRQANLVFDAYATAKRTSAEPSALASPWSGRHGSIDRAGQPWARPAIHAVMSLQTNDFQARPSEAETAESYET